MLVQGPAHRAGLCGWPVGGFALAPRVACLDQDTTLSSPSPSTLGLLAESTQLLLEAPYLALQSANDLCILPRLGLQQGWSGISKFAAKAA